VSVFYAIYINGVDVSVSATDPKKLICGGKIIYEYIYVVHVTTY